MELREMRYVLAVAEAGHVGRAATALFVSQPSLSQAIRTTERSLGITLFTRTRTGMELTDAGRELLPGLRRTLRAAERAEATARALATGATGHILLGFEASGAGPLLTRIRRRFATEHPGVVLDVRRYDWGGEVRALRAGEVDIAVVWQPNDLTDLATLPLATEPRLIGLPLEHPLADRDELRLTDIAGLPLGWTREVPRYWVNWWAINPRPDGSTVHWGRENRSVEEMLEFAAAGEGACISPSSLASYYVRPDLRWIPLTDAPPLEIDLAWEPNRNDRALHALVAAARLEVQNPPHP